MLNNNFVNQLMGIYSSRGSESQKKDHLWVGTLNYSGILKSPFEFYTDEQDNSPLSQISNIFKSVAPEYWNNFKTDSMIGNILDTSLNKTAMTAKWPLGKVDRLFQDRYSPLYDAECGVDQYLLLDNSKEF